MTTAGALSFTMLLFLVCGLLSAGASGIAVNHAWPRWVDRTRRAGTAFALGELWPTTVLVQAVLLALAAILLGWRVLPELAQQPPLCWLSESWLNGLAPVLGTLLSFGLWLSAVVLGAACGRRYQTLSSRFGMWLFSGLVPFFRVATKRLTWVLGPDPNWGPLSPGLSRSASERLFAGGPAGSRNGHPAEGQPQVAFEHHLALEALRLGQRTARDIMQPRLDLDALEVDTPAAEVFGAVAMAGYTRLLVYESDLDHILGYIHIREVLRRHYLGVALDLRKILRPVVFVPESLPLDRLLVMLQQRRCHLAVVLDEFGGTQGVVSLQDILDELVGKTSDEESKDHPQILARPGGGWWVEGATGVEDFYQQIQAGDLPQNGPRRYSTVAGLVLSYLGDIPTVGQTISAGGLSFQVLRMDGGRIDRLLVTPESEHLHREGDGTSR